ncbi:MAG TPA: hypothetical protein VM938_09490 [Acidimicrobiales bacterium]|nr:hypothetical protein [Acidimicrobiales bacterium]
MPAGAPPEERDLRPRSAMELADVAVAACRRSFLVLAAVALAFALPASALFWLVLAVGTPLTTVVGVVVLAIGLALAHAGCVHVVGDDWFGGTPAAAPAIRTTWRRAPAVVGLWLTGGVKVAVLTLAFVVPGVWAALGLVPAVPAMVLERISPGNAVRRAAVLSLDRRAAHLGALLAALALVVALVLILVQPVVVASVIGSGRDAPLLVGVAAAQLAVCVLVIPLFAAVSMAAYVDARIRKEALDLLYLLTPAAAA